MLDKLMLLLELLLQIQLLIFLEIHHVGLLQAHPSLLILECRLHSLKKEIKNGELNRRCWEKTRKSYSSITYQ
jgi:hypothetical protein